MGCGPAGGIAAGAEAKRAALYPKGAGAYRHPANKIDRVQAELARLAADKTLTRAELTQLAKKIAAVLL